jgi:hypothetical protein
MEKSLMDRPFKVVRRRGKQKVAAWSSTVCGSSTLLDIFGMSANGVRYYIGRSLSDDSEKLRDDARAVGRDFAHVLRSAVDR